MNKVILVGNLVRDPEYRTTGSGIPVCNFRIAVTRRFANQQGVRESDFIDCVAWRQQADFVHRFFGKGRKIGVIGSSAGGHLAATLLTKFDNGNPKADNAIDRVSSRPDFGILCYPVISMKNGITHIGSRNNLIGKKPNPELIEELSAELHVRNNTPPCFIWHTAADRGVLPENSMRFASALAKKNIPYDLHIYQKGGHGIGLRAKFPFTNAHPWSKDVVFWLKENKIID